MAQYNIGVFIGRFQPFHLGHLHIIKTALAACEQLVIIVGSAKRAATVRNPFSYEQRKALIEANLSHYDRINGTDFAKRVQVEPVVDQLYYEAQWIRDVIAAVERHAKPAQSVALIGHDKDSSTYYLQKFPQWSYLAVENFQGIDATKIRLAYFTEQMTDKVWQTLPEPSLQFLVDFQHHSLFSELQAEQRYLLSHRNDWSLTPYPPIFSTTDSVVLCAGHILVIQRKFSPGKGLWALPGGYLEVNEWVQTGLLRELKEETSIDLTDEALLQSFITLKVFDHPQRSQIGRVITHAGLFKLPGERLPAIQATDDAKQARWWPLADLAQLQDKMHDDHYQIIQYCLREFP